MTMAFGITFPNRGKSIRSGRVVVVGEPRDLGYREAVTGTSFPGCDRSGWIRSRVRTVAVHPGLWDFTPLASRLIATAGILAPRIHLPPRTATLSPRFERHAARRVLLSVALFLDLRIRYHPAAPLWLRALGHGTGRCGVPPMGPGWHGLAVQESPMDGR